MPPKRKGFGFKKSHIDDTLYQLMYYAYSNKVKIQRQAQNRVQVKKNDTFAIISQEGIQTILKFPFSGQVLGLPDIPVLNQSEIKNVVLCNFRLCDHEPKPMKTQNEKDHCIHCGQVLWYYYSKHIIQYSVLQIQNKMEINLHSENVNFEWTVIKNESFTHQTQIAKTQDRKLILDFAGRVMEIEPFPFKQTEGQDLDKKIVLKVNKVICRHESIMNGICQYCLVPISIKRYLFQAPGPTLSGRVLQQAEDHYIKKILQQKRAVLILDLDNTILHSVEKHQISQEDFEQMNEYYLIPDAPPEIIMPRIVVKMRPNFGLFLKTITQLYQIYIYTKGTRDYAQAICQCVRRQYKDILQHTEWFTPNRIFTRDQQPYTDKKNIGNVLPVHRQCVIILDDRRDIWDVHYCVFVKQYFYFRKNKQDGRLQVTGKNDCYLSYATKILRDIHKHYFELKRIESQNIELSRIHAKYKSQLLKQYRVKYFLVGVAEGGMKLDENNIYRRGKKIGLKTIADNQRPNLIIRSSNVSKEWLGKISQDLKHYSQTLKIPVICEHWIHACYEYTFAFPYHAFELQDPFIEQVHIQKFEQIIAQTANKLH